MTRSLVARRSISSPRTSRRNSTLYILDEPTTGLHRRYREAAGVLRLVDAGNGGHRHNLDVIKVADWVIITIERAAVVVAQGPRVIAACPDRTPAVSWKKVLERG